MKLNILIITILFSTLSWGQSDVSNIELTNLNQERIPLSEIISKDKYTLLSIGGTWCKPCLLQKPFVASLEKQYPQYLKVIFIFSRDTAEKVMSQFGEISTSTSYYLLDESEIHQLAITSYPTNILVNAQGKIVRHDISINDVGRLIK